MLLCVCCLLNATYEIFSALSSFFFKFCNFFFCANCARIVANLNDTNIRRFFVNVKAKLSTYENGDMWKTFSCESVYYYYREPNPKPLLIIILHFIPDYDSAHAFFPYSLFSARALSKKKNGGSFATSPVLIVKMYRCTSHIVHRLVALRIVPPIQARKACYFRALPRSLNGRRRVERLAN